MKSINFLSILIIFFAFLCSVFLSKYYLDKYDVNISNQGIGQFVNQDVDVVYWISAEAQYSTVSK